jgi:hypothetical protein
MGMTLKTDEPQTNKVLIPGSTEECANGNIAIVNPDPRNGRFEITADQLRSLRRKYEQNADGASSFEEFLTRVSPGGIGNDQYILLRWCGMSLGIETDGYAHS